MNGNGPRVVAVLPAGAHVARQLADDLRASGIDLEIARSGREALRVARARRPDALLAIDAPANGWIRAAARDASLASVPVVGVTAIDPRGTLFLPFVTPVRWDAEIHPHEAYLRGLSAGAIRRATERGPRVPETRRERLGVWLCRAGSGLLAAGFGLFAWELAQGIRGRGPVTANDWILPIAAGIVAGGLGVRLVRGMRLGLRWGTWLFVALAALHLALRAYVW